MVSKTKQLAYWEGRFGDDYSTRNADLALFKKRQPFFHSLLTKHSDIKTILEVGCNIGGNLWVLHKINPLLQLTAIEPNKRAAIFAQKLVPAAQIYETDIFESKWKNSFGLVFTAGVLIHIGNADLIDALRRIYIASRKYILTIEYYSPQSESVPYRGLNDALFKRPYDDVWKQHYPTLRLLEQGTLIKKDGFDDCFWWLLKKTDS